MTDDTGDSDEGDDGTASPSPTDRSVATRFKPGHPKLGGRKKGTKNFSTLFLEACDRKVRVTEGGRTRKLSLRELGAVQMANRVGRGDDKATALLREYEAQLASPGSASFVSDPHDEPTIADIMARFRATLPPEAASTDQAQADEGGAAATPPQPEAA